MGREDVSMTGEEVRAFLDRKHRLVFGTLRADGSPTAELAACGYDGEALWVLVPEDSESRANARRDARVSCTLEEFPSYFEIKGVIAHGHAREATPDERARLGARFARPPEGSSVLRVPIERVVTFDFGKIRRRS